MHDKDGLTPLHFASRRDRNVKLASLILNKGAKVDATDKAGRTPLHWASRRGNINIVTLLMNKGAKSVKDKSGKNPFDLAKENGHTKVVGLLEKINKPAGESAGK